VKGALTGLLALAALAGAADTPFRAPARAAEFEGVAATARYIALKDGTRIAIDLLLPKDLAPGARVPAILKISRLGRASVDGRVSGEDRFWAEHGYARILVDERGTGASFGTSRLGAATISDLAEIVDWITAQPWSNGRVGASGVSVEGTASELLAATGRPAVGAVAPLFSDFDYYADVLRPGGVLDRWVTRTFQAFTAGADAGGAVKRVDSDTDGALARAAVAEHRSNLDIDAEAREAEFADDRLAAAGGSFESLSASSAAGRLARGRTPILAYVSWLDAGTVQGALRRFRDLPNPQTVIIGAWSHAGDHGADPFSTPGAPVTPSILQRRAELLQFFDARLKTGARPPPPERIIWYYTLGENRWRSTPRWPPAGIGQTSFHLAGESLLAGGGHAATRALRLVQTDTGLLNRWHTQVGGQPVDYHPVIEAMQSLPGFTTAPLDRDTEITGQPVLRLSLTRSQAGDPAVFAYLAAVDPQGHAIYLTEGQLRLASRKPAAGPATGHSFRRSDAAPPPIGRSFEADVTLLPTSVLVRKGWRLRLLLASGDRSTFDTAGDFDATVSSESTLILPTRKPARWS
jgi:putative CocE/NonD family hydrolase